MRDALAAADELAGDGIDAEVVDLRTLRPLDLETVLESVAKTNRLLAVEEGPRTGGWATRRARRGRRGRRCTTSTTPGSSPPTRRPIPYSPTLEDAFIPSAKTIVESVSSRFAAAR